ncbi:MULTISPECIES: hypothetical protein [Cohnella]|uniref:hypothetical protein n=1 Tax=Cohnella TaxID=329857 RepID=UPI00111B5F42|nr:MULTISPECIES: hypothetical protein [Cohnella]MBN2980243.1 hypothetical protein [Cohnella algarum]
MGENAEKALPDWTKSNEAENFREKADFRWMKSNQAASNRSVSRSIPLNPAQPLNPAKRTFRFRNKEVRLSKETAKRFSYVSAVLSAYRRFFSNPEIFRPHRHSRRANFQFPPRSPHSSVPLPAIGQYKTKR